ncbi:MAG TPA: 2-nitropropane dioxygenase, partial [Firmicutes bacterium]|nr:2-nitropropane dioxygenase [Bacillota bacterium]
MAREGGVGLIAASGMTLDELREEINLARSLSGGQGIIGINAMVAARQFLDLVRTAIAAGIDLVVAGAGFSRDMFQLGKDAGVPIVPIASSVRVAKLSEHLGASAVVVEGQEAGGHLGTDQPMKKILPEIKKSVSIPVIAAGGIIDGY